MSVQLAEKASAQLDLREDGFVTFRLAEQWLGIPVLMIQEVLSRADIRPVPLAPSEVHGFLNLRGRIVTAVDLRTVLGLPAREEGAAFMHVVVEHDEELFSLLVDEVGDVVKVGEAGLEPTPSTLDPVWRRCCCGVVRLERGLLVVLEADLVLGAVSPEGT